MKPLLLFLLLSTAAWGQDKKTIVSVGYSRYQVSDIDMKDTIYDTVQVTLLVRIQGRPWAFFHDGWEVRKVTTDDGNRSQPGSMLLWHDASAVGRPIYSHLLYLDSSKRPIRKEWVVYETFKR